MQTYPAVDISAITSGLILGDDGIWHTPGGNAISYPPDGNESCFAVEDNSFWFRHRNCCIVSVVNSFPPLHGGTIFDIGGGNGFVSLGLADAGYDVALIEPGRAGASNARKRGIGNVICGTTETAQFKERVMPAVGLFDVIEHIEDHLSFLKSISLLLKHGGLLYATVPALPLLWSEEDALAGHFRRYTLNSICDTVRSSGFEIVFASYLFRLLPLPILLSRVLPYRIGITSRQKGSAKASRDHAVEGGMLVSMMNRVLAAEVENLKHKRPMRAFGGSCLVVARCS